MKINRYTQYNIEIEIEIEMRNFNVIGIENWPDCRDWLANWLL